MPGFNDVIFTVMAITHISAVLGCFTHRTLGRCLLKVGQRQWRRNRQV
jgi:hypothetical protein